MLDFSECVIVIVIVAVTREACLKILTVFVRCMVSTPEANDLRLEAYHAPSRPDRCGSKGRNGDAAVDIKGQARTIFVWFGVVVEPDGRFQHGRICANPVATSSPERQLSG